MTQEEQDAILGRTMRAHKEAKKKLAALTVLNGEIAATAKKLASALGQHPDRIYVSKEPEGRMALAGALYIYTPEDAEQLSAGFLREHLAEYVSVQAEKARLRQQLIDLGEDDPEPDDTFHL